MRIIQIMIFLEIHLRITNNLKNHRYPLDNHESMKIIEIHMIVTNKNENLRNLCENHENHENHRNP